MLSVSGFVKSVSDSIGDCMLSMHWLTKHMSNIRCIDMITF